MLIEFLTAIAIAFRQNIAINHI